MTDEISWEDLREKLSDMNVVVGGCRDFVLFRSGPYVDGWTTKHVPIARQAWEAAGRPKSMDVNGMYLEAR